MEAPAPPGRAQRGAAVPAVEEVAGLGELLRRQLRVVLVRAAVLVALLLLRLRLRAFLCCRYYVFHLFACEFR